MEVGALKHQIQSKHIDNVLVFYGDEWEVQKIYIAQIAKATGLETKRVDKISDIIHKIKSVSFVSKEYIYIVRDDTEYIQNEKLQSLVARYIGKNYFILLLSSVDKRLKFYKDNKDNMIEFEPLKPPILKKYIQKQIALSDKACDKLMEVCEYNYGRCLLEIDKIKRYFVNTWNKRNERERDGGISWTHKCFEKLLEDGTIYTPPKDAIFEFVDAILDDDYIKAFDLYQQCKAVGEATLVMISVLYNNAKAVLQVQSCTTKDIGKSTGLSGWQIMNAKKHTGIYKNVELIRIMELCRKCEQGIKTGKMEEQFAVEYILVGIL